MGSRLRMAALGTPPLQRCKGSSLRKATLFFLVIRSVLFMGHPASASGGIEAEQLPSSNSATTTTKAAGGLSSFPEKLFAAHGDSFAVRGDRIVRVAEAYPPSVPASAEAAETVHNEARPRRPRRGKQDPAQTKVSPRHSSGDAQGSSCDDAGKAAGKTSRTASHSCGLPVVRLDKMKAVSVNDDYWRWATLPPYERFLQDDFYLTGDIFNGVGQGHSWDLDSLASVHDLLLMPKMYPDPKVEKVLCGIFVSVGGVNAARTRIYGEMQQAQSGSPELWRSWSALGNTWRCQGHARRALTCYLQSLRYQRETDADSRIVRFNIAMVFQSSRRLDDAKAVLQAIKDEVQTATDSGMINYDANGQLALYNWKLCELNVLLNLTDEQKCSEYFEVCASPWQ